jgi:GTP cyclohydrolase II
MIYMDQEGRGIGLANKLLAYQLQENGLDTVEANEALGLPTDARHYQFATDALIALGVTRCRLLTNNPHKAEACRAAGIETALCTMPCTATPSNHRYLSTKIQKMHHHPDLLET